MSLYQKDFILRMIESVAATLRRALRRREDGDVDGARQDVAMSIAEVLGPSAAMVPMVDATTAANLLSDPQRIALYLQLLEVDAELLDAKGLPDRGRAGRHRAAELALELVLRRVELPDDTIGMIHRLLGRADRTAMAPRYRDAWDEALRLTPRQGPAA